MRIVIQIIPEIDVITPGWIINFHDMHMMGPDLVFKITHNKEHLSGMVCITVLYADSFQFGDQGVNIV